MCNVGKPKPTQWNKPTLWFRFLSMKNVPVKFWFHKYDCINEDLVGKFRCGQYGLAIDDRCLNLIIWPFPTELADRVADADLFFNGIYLGGGAISSRFDIQFMDEEEEALYVLKTLGTGR
jgi:hypothetical protein